MLISLLILVVFAIIALWIIQNFFPEPIRMVALVIVGVICLFALLNILGVLGAVPARLIN